MSHFFSSSVAFERENRLREYEPDAVLSQYSVNCRTANRLPLRLTMI
jgi:hypothetical protein